MFVLWIAGGLLALSVFLIFALPVIMMGPRAVLGNTQAKPANKILAGGLVAIGASLFLVAGSFIQSPSADTISAQNFYSLHTQA